MKRVMVVVSFAVAIGLLGCSKAESQKPEARAPSAAARALKPQETCPVMGGKVDKSICTIYKGRCVYFCCQMCPEKFKKDPEKYVKKLEAEGVSLADASACERDEGHGGAVK